MEVFNTPILMVVFNRPTLTKKVFEVIRRIKPTRLYVAADGPRPDNPKDKRNCLKTQGIFKDINWDCELKTLFRKENQGCRDAVSSSISWFFENEEQGIILEDDCLPDLSFFPYCEDLLNYYKDNPFVLQISGNNFQNGIKRGKASYYFSRYNHIWGWATWREAWKLFDIEMKSFPEMKEMGFLDTIFLRKQTKQYWMQIFEKLYNKEITTSWAYIWTYCNFANNGLTVIPNVNLVSNIGFSVESTHTHIVNPRTANLPPQNIKRPLTHPKIIANHKAADLYTFKNVYKLSYIKKTLMLLHMKW